jgi:hypothetical protein
LKEVALLNIEPICVTLLTFHELNADVPVNTVHPLNIEVISVTLDKIGVSDAETCKLIQPLNALDIDDQTILPHCVIFNIFLLSPILAKFILGNVPTILI